MHKVSYGHRRLLEGVNFQQAVARTTAALKEEGFGVLSEIDVSATLMAKLGVDYPRYVILGACNPSLAHQALTAEPEIGLLLPCNVVVAETVGGAEVQALDPREIFKLVDNRKLQPLAEEVSAKLRRALDQI